MLRVTLTRKALQHFLDREAHAVDLPPLQLPGFDFVELSHLTVPDGLLLEVKPDELIRDSCEVKTRRRRCLILRAIGARTHREAVRGGSNSQADGAVECTLADGLCPRDDAGDGVALACSPSLSSRPELLLLLPRPAKEDHQHDPILPVDTDEFLAALVLTVVIHLGVCNCLAHCGRRARLVRLLIAFGFLMLGRVEDRLAVVDLLGV